MKRSKRILSLFLSAVSVFTCFNTGALSMSAKAAGMQSQLIAQYNFDETNGTTVTDASGHGNNATLKGGASFAPSEGRTCGAVKLDGTSGYVQLPKELMKDVHNVTFTANVKVAASVTNSWVLSVGPDSGTYIMINSRNSGGKIGCAITTYGGSGNGWRGEQGASGSSLTADTWANVALVISNDTHTMKMYVNGTLIATNTSLTSDPAAMYKAGEAFSGYIGKSPYSDPYLKGLVDDFRVYNVALTDADVQGIANAAVTATQPTQAVTFAGAAPQMPAVVHATWSDGASKDTLVGTWAAIDPSSYAAKGSFSVQGSIPNSSAMANATVYVMDPLSVTSTGKTSGSVSLNITPVAGATKYSIFRASSVGGEAVCVYSGTSTTFTDTELDQNFTYYYTASYNDGVNESPKTAQVAVTTDAGAPAVPKALAQGEASSKRVSLSWAASNGAEAYLLYRSDSAAGTYTTVYEGAALSYVDTNITAGKDYFYKISAKSALGESAMSASLKASTKPVVEADWKLDRTHVKSGTIASGNLVFSDASGNGNDLVMQTYGASKDMTSYVKFSDEEMKKTGSGSLELTGDSVNKLGADFITQMGAPINSEQFKDGYTIELLYRLPDYWTASDGWSGLLAKQGSSVSMPEPGNGTTSLSISNCKEIQYESSNAADDASKMMNTCWSLSMDEANKWYSIVVVNDNNTVRTYINGADAFRDYVGQSIGIYCDPNDGRIRIGSSGNTGSLDRFAKGNLQEVRLSNGALNQSDWLIPNAQDYVGEYGTDKNFSLKDPANYNMVFIPDTQNEIKFEPQVLNGATDWIIQNKKNANIVSITHLGDLVEDWDNAVQYATAYNTFTNLAKGGIPFLIQPGNHDFKYRNSVNGISDGYASFFKSGTPYAQAQPTVQMTSPSGLSSYMIYEGGSYKYMVVSCAWWYQNNANDMAWLESILKANPNIPTIVTSHDLQGCSDTKPSSITLDTSGKTVWNVAKKYNQVFAMVGGHNHGSGDEILTNDSGNPVISVLADYQFSYNGGNGFMKFLEFGEKANKVYLNTFSPYSASIPTDKKTYFDTNYMSGPGNYDEINFNFAQRFAGMALSTNGAAAAPVISAISSLPAQIALADKDAVKAARTAYDALSADAKLLVTNYSTLTSAESAIAQLEDQQAAQAAANAVIGSINSLPSSITLQDKAAVQAARTAYDALTNAAKAYVTNYAVLQSAEAAIQKLEAPVNNNPGTTTPGTGTTTSGTEKVIQAAPATGNASQLVTIGSADITGMQPQDNINARFDGADIHIPSEVVNGLLGGDTGASLVMSVENSSQNSSGFANAMLAGNDLKPVAAFEIKMVKISSDGTQQQVHSLGGKVKVTLYLEGKVPAGTDGSTLDVYYYNPDTGKYESMKAVYDKATNSLSFYTDHYSTYVIGAKQTSASGSPSTGDTANHIPDMVILGFSAIALLVLYATERKKKKVQ